MKEEKKTKIKIMDTLRRFPGGIFVIPLLLSAFINTLFPQAFLIGGMVSPLFKNGSMMIIGFILFCCGTTISYKEFIRMLKQNSAYVIIKLMIIAITGLLVHWVIPPKGIFGIPGVALFAVFSSTNPALYLEQVKRYGTDVDEAAFPLINVITTTAVPMFIYEITGLADSSFSGIRFLSLICPFIIGFIIGNLDSSVGDFFKNGIGMMIPVLAINIGANINLLETVHSGAAGLILSVLYLIINIGIFLLFDKIILKRPGYLGVSWCSVAGVSTAVVNLIVDSDPSLEPYRAISISMIAIATIVTNILMPIINKKFVSIWGCGLDNT